MYICSMRNTYKVIDWSTLNKDAFNGIEFKQKFNQPLATHERIRLRQYIDACLSLPDESPIEEKENLDFNKQSGFIDISNVWLHDFEFETPNCLRCGIRMYVGSVIEGITYDFNAFEVILERAAYEITGQKDICIYHYSISSYRQLISSM